MRQRGAAVARAAAPARRRRRRPLSARGGRVRPAGARSTSPRRASARTPDATVDATADLFQVRHAGVRADGGRRPALHHGASRARRGAHTITTFTRAATVRVGARTPAARTDERSSVWRDARPSIIVPIRPQPVRGRRVASIASGRRDPGSASREWRLLVKHPSGSLEAAVNSTRRRNLLVSSSILGVLGASMMLLVLSARRSQELARQQMEFVAAVSHELRTPLAVIRSAGDNLADGVVADAGADRASTASWCAAKGGACRRWSNRSSSSPGIHSGQRPLRAAAGRRLRAGRRRARVVGRADRGRRASRSTSTIPRDLPPVAGDEPALRRVFQNLVGNAIKYGAEGRWIGIERARSAGDGADRDRRSRPRHRGRGAERGSSSRSIAPPTSSRRRYRAPASGSVSSIGSSRPMAAGSW